MTELYNISNITEVLKNNDIDIVQMRSSEILKRRDCLHQIILCLLSVYELNKPDEEVQNIIGSIQNKLVDTSRINLMFGQRTNYTELIVKELIDFLKLSGININHSVYMTNAIDSISNESVKPFLHWAYNTSGDSSREVYPVFYLEGDGSKVSSDHKIRIKNNSIATSEQIQTYSFGWENVVNNRYEFIVQNNFLPGKKIVHRDYKTEYLIIGYSLKSEIILLNLSLNTYTIEGGMTRLEKMELALPE